MRSGKMGGMFGSALVNMFLMVLLLFSMQVICSCGDRDKFFQEDDGNFDPEVLAVPVKTLVVNQAKVFPSIKVIGNIRQKEKADITPLIAGRVDRVLRDTGDYVQSGEILAYLDQKFAKIKLEQADNNYISAGNALNAARMEYEEQLKKIEGQFLNLEKLKAELVDSGNTVKQTEEEIAKKEELFKIGGIPREELNTLRYQYLTVKKNYFIAEQDLRIAEIGYRDRDIVAAGYKVPDSEEQKITILKEINTRMLRLKIEDAKTNLEKARLEKETARIEFEETIIRTPITGYIGERYIHLGERVDEKAKLFTIIDTEQVYWVVTVTELEAGKILIGNSCEFTIDALNNKKFSGKVAIISPLVDIKSRTVEIRILLDNKKKQLNPGMFGRGVILGDVKQQLLQIPVTTFITYDGQKATIFVVKKNRAFKREITVGTEENDMVEVLEGLEDGEMVIDEPPVNLINGMLISP